MQELDGCRPMHVRFWQTGSGGRKFATWNSVLRCNVLAGVSGIHTNADTSYAKFEVAWIYSAEGVEVGGVSCEPVSLKLTRVGPCARIY